MFGAANVQMWVINKEGPHARAHNVGVRMLVYDGKTCLTRECNGTRTDGGDVRVVPRVVIHQCGAVRHAGDLVTVVPPTAK